jgi:CheY-like chemotaxis protein
MFSKKSYRKFFQNFFKPRNRKVVIKKVLVIDDEQDILELWISQIKLMDILIEVHSATNGLEGLTLTNAVPNYDLIITDFKMPQMNGLEFIQKLRENHNYHETPVMFFTGYLPELKEHTSNLENVFLFDKPFISDKLKTNIKMCLKL